MTAASRTPPGRARTDAERPDWFRAFLADRATRKPSQLTSLRLRRIQLGFDAELFEYRMNLDALPK